MMMVVVMMVMMDNHRAVLSHLVAAHLLASFFLCKGGDGDAERNDKSIDASKHFINGFITTLKGRERRLNHIAADTPEQGGAPRPAATGWLRVPGLI